MIELAGGDELHARVHALAMERAAMIEEQIREALGRWVSEIEPVLAFGPGSRFLGIGDGSGRVSIHGGELGAR